MGFPSYFPNSMSKKKKKKKKIRLLLLECANIWWSYVIRNTKLVNEIGKRM